MHSVEQTVLKSLNPLKHIISNVPETKFYLAPTLPLRSGDLAWKNESNWLKNGSGIYEIFDCKTVNVGKKLILLPSESTCSIIVIFKGFVC